MKTEPNAEEPKKEEPITEGPKDEPPKTEEPKPEEPKPEEPKPTEEAPKPTEVTAEAPKPTEETPEAPKAAEGAAATGEGSKPTRKNTKKAKEPKPQPPPVDYHSVMSGYVEKKGRSVVLLQRTCVTIYPSLHAQQASCLALVVTG